MSDEPNPRPLADSGSVAAATHDIADLAAATTAPTRPLLEAGARLAGRYQILRFVANGGMGEVYEADDLELGERVALKTVRPDLACDAPALERFKRELLLARKVTHPNVCRIFDVGYHLADADAPIVFLTMEFLPGVTLAQRIKERGRLPEDEVLQIATQLCWGLQSAHKAGVVHRDFKSGNVILAPAQGRLRAVVTDFGQARLARSEDGSSAGVTIAGSTVGSPAYMAPEQLLGHEVTAAADIYALGVVLFEMATGEWPFQGSSPLAVATRRLRDDPPSPRTLCPDISPHVEATILRCLRREPEERFTSVVEVARALEGSPVSVPAPAAARDFSRPLVRIGAWTTTFGVLALLALLAVQRPGPAPAVSPTAPVRLGRTLAVLGFKNLSGRAESGWLSAAFTEMLGAELAADGELRALPGETLARLHAEMPLLEAEGLAPDTLRRVRERIGAEVIVSGAYVASPGGPIRLVVRAQDATTGETLATLVETGSEAGLVPMLERVGERFRAALGVKPRAQPSPRP
jgi:tRNA A-37 threonylcarbamoyl transferase component Bud32/TolB-like protein